MSPTLKGLTFKHHPKLAGLRRASHCVECRRLYKLREEVKAKQRALDRKRRRTKRYHDHVKQYNRSPERKAASETDDRELSRQTQEELERAEILRKK